MSSFVITQIDVAIQLFTSLTQHGGGSPAYRSNLQWLAKLRARASSKIAAQKGNREQNYRNDTRRSSAAGEDSEDVELLGWRTRLIERGGHNRQTVRTIHNPSTPATSQITQDTNPLASRTPFAGPETNMQNPSLLFVTPDSTNDLVSTT